MKFNRKGICEYFNNFNHKEKPTNRWVIQTEVSHTVLNLSGISPTTKLVFLKIIQETVLRARYYTFMRQKDIARHLGIGPRSVIRAMKELVENEWISLATNPRNPSA